MISSIVVDYLPILIFLGIAAFVAAAAVGLSFIVAKQKPDTFAVVLPTFGVKTYFGFIGRKDADFKGLNDAIQASMLKIKRARRLPSRHIASLARWTDMPIHCRFRSD